MQNLLKSYVLVLAIQFTILPQQVQAQDEGFIYGKVTTEDGDEFIGAIRWGKEEVYWTDMFNASKVDNENIDYLSREERDQLRYRNRRGGDWDDRVSTWVSHNWDDRGRSYIHQFSVQFGEIKSIRVYRGDEADIELRDGTRVEVDGSGYNDMGTKVKVIDAEIGEIDLSWSRIEEIEFMSTPKKLDDKFGDALYGTVDSEIGEFTGYIQWDHDERVSKDVLDGDTYDGDVSIAFGKITSITNDGNRSDVVLKSGRELTLRGSNDVNYENRGIIVTVAGVGRVDIPWKEFNKVTFKEAKNSGKSYDDFKNPDPLEAKVVTKNGTLEGRIVYDLDEALDIEVLHGKDDRSEYVIPFRNIKKIRPRGYQRSEVELRNGTKLMLEESQDVSEENTGLLVYEGNNPMYVPWEDVEEIIFN